MPKIINVYENYSPDDYHPGRTSLNPSEPFSEVRVDIEDQVKSLEEMMADYKKDTEEFKAALKQVGTDQDESKRIFIETSIMDLIKANGLNDTNFNDEESLRTAKAVFEKTDKLLEGLEASGFYKIPKAKTDINDLSNYHLDNTPAATDLPITTDSLETYQTLKEVIDKKVAGTLVYRIGQSFNILEPLCVIKIKTNTKTGMLPTDIEVTSLPSAQGIISSRTPSNANVWIPDLVTFNTYVANSTPEFPIGSLHYVYKENVFVKSIPTTDQIFIETGLAFVAIFATANQLRDFVAGFMNDMASGYRFIINLDEFGARFLLDMFGPIFDMMMGFLDTLLNSILGFLRMILKLFIKLFAILIIILSIKKIIEMIIEIFAMIGPMLNEIQEMIGAYLNPALIPKILAGLLAKLQAFIMSLLDQIVAKFKSMILSLASDVPLYLLEQANTDPVGAIKASVELITGD